MQYLCITFHLEMEKLLRRVLPCATPYWPAILNICKLKAAVLQARREKKQQQEQEKMGNNVQSMDENDVEFDGESSPVKDTINTILLLNLEPEVYKQVISALRTQFDTKFFMGTAKKVPESYDGQQYDIAVSIEYLNKALALNCKRMYVSGEKLVITGMNQAKNKVEMVLQKNNKQEFAWQTRTIKCQ